MGIINIAVDVTFSAGWWILRRTVGGIYNGVSYLIYGDPEKEKEKDLRNLLEEQNQKIMDLTNMVSELKNGKIESTQI